MRLPQDPALVMAERQEKQARVQRYLAEHRLDALVLGRPENFAWMTGGGSSRIVSTAEAGPVFLVLTATDRYAVTSVSEARRLAEEELDGLGYDLRSCRWDQDPGTRLPLPAGGRVAADVPLPGLLPAGPAFQRLRYSLTAAETERYRWLCRTSAAAVAAVCLGAAPGETEANLAARLAAALAPDGVAPSVVLVAADERVWRYRHPLPTDRRLERYLMVVLVAEKWGMHAALTRLVHFGPVPGELGARVAAAARVDASLHAATRPGARAADVFRAGIAAYAAAGYPHEWQLHHQGGAIGYGPREYVATDTCPEVAADQQPFAWNPSIAGAKCEDTILCTAAGPEVLTATAGWPLVHGRPGILER